MYVVYKVTGLQGKAKHAKAIITGCHYIAKTQPAIPERD
jgi:hypothetical protein